MKFKIICAIAITAVLFSCKSKKDDRPAFVPYHIFIQNDLAKLDAEPLIVFAFTIDTNGKVVDSAVIQKADFKNIAKQFTEPFIGDKKLKVNYNEDSYADETVGTFNFTYTPMTKVEREKLLITAVTVGTSIGDNSKFRNLLISRREEKTGNTQQLYWEAGKYCIIKTIEKNNNIVTKKYNWGI
jgi:hypothetical protein